MSIEGSPEITPEAETLIENDENLAFALDRFAARMDDEIAGRREDGDSDKILYFEVNIDGVKGWVWIGPEKE